jgi:hypothetical protein
VNHCGGVLNALAIYSSCDHIQFSFLRPGAAHFVLAVNFGLTVQASTGAIRNELLRIAEIALKAWPK